MGVVINRPIDMQLNELFEQIKLDVDDNKLSKQRVFFGGPVQVDRGFVLHHPKGDWKSTISIHGDTALTTSKDILEAMAKGEGPDKVIVALGYAGWGAGQLENEMAQNAWLSVQASDAIIFDLPYDQKLAAAMRLLGVDFASLSDEAGHA